MIYSMNSESRTMSSSNYLTSILHLEPTQSLPQYFQQKNQSFSFQNRSPSSLLNRNSNRAFPMIFQMHNVLVSIYNSKIMSKQQINIQFENYEQVQAYSQKNGKTLLILDDYILDVTTFATHHPGGGVMLRNNNLKNVGDQMKFHHPLTLIMANSMVIGSFKKEISRIISPDKPLLPQIWDLDESSYMKVINSPHWLFVPSPRMFESDFIEFFSHNKWYSITVLPFIVISFMFYSIASWETFNLPLSILTALIGFLFFTLTEYCLHRFVFHSESYLPDIKAVRYLHYIMHGIHHMLPNDPDRLVYPPFLGVCTFIIGLQTVAKVIVIADPILSVIFWSFFLIGYMTYDICHYSLHHIDTTKNPNGYFHKLQQYHNQHHFGGEQAGFGVSSPLWDIVFKTGYKKNKKSE